MSSPEDDRLRAALEEAHGGEAPPPFHALLARSGAAAARPAPRRWAVLVALPALALTMAVCSTLLSRPPGAPAEATPMNPGELSTLGELNSPLDFLLEPGLTGGLSGVPAFDVSTSTAEPLEVTKGLRP